MIMIRQGVLCLAAALALSACGGGGGGAPNATVPLTQAISNYVGGGMSANASVTGWLLDSQSNRIDFTGSATIAESQPAPDALKGAQVIRVTETINGSLTAGGTTVPLSSSLNYYRNSSTMALAQIGDEGGDAAWEVYPSYTYPDTVKPNDGGPLATALVYYGASPGTVVGTDALSYSVAADTGTSVLYTQVYKTLDNASRPVAETDETYRVTSQGAMALVSVHSALFASSGATLMSTDFTVQP